jgi:hypothetical protein
VNAPDGSPADSPEGWLGAGGRRFYSPRAAFR